MGFLLQMGIFPQRRRVGAAVGIFIDQCISSLTAVVLDKSNAALAGRQADRGFRHNKGRKGCKTAGQRDWILGGLGYAHEGARWSIGREEVRLSWWGAASVQFAI